MASKTETIRSPSTGMTRRTTIGKRWVVIAQQDEVAPCDMLTFASEAKARECCHAIGVRFSPLVHYVEQAEVV